MSDTTQAEATAKPLDDNFADQNRISQIQAAIPKTDTLATIDASSIPEDVRQQMQGFDNLELDQMLLNILSVPGFIYTTDKIILTLWANYQKKAERMRVLQRLRQLARQGFVTKQEKSRGIFSITETGRQAVAKK